MNYESKHESDETEDSLQYLNEAIDLNGSLVLEDDEEEVNVGTTLLMKEEQQQQQQKSFVDNAELRLFNDSWSRKSPPATVSGLNDANSFLFVQPYWGGGKEAENKKPFDASLKAVDILPKSFLAISSNKHVEMDDPISATPQRVSTATPILIAPELEALPKENVSPCPSIEFFVLKEEASLQIALDVCHPGNYVLIEKTSNSLLKNFRESRAVVTIPLEYGVEKQYEVINVLKNKPILEKRFTLPPTTPSAPQNVTCVQRTCKSLKLQFDAPFFDGGAKITSFLVVCNTDYSNPKTVEVPMLEKKNTLTCKIEDLSPNEQVVVTISAKNSAGVGSSTSPEVFCTLLSIPRAIEDLRHTFDNNIPSTCPWIVWSKEASVDEFELYYKLSKPAKDAPLSDYVLLYSGNESKVRLKDLLPTSEYQVKVRARNVEGWSKWSNAYCFTTGVNAPLAPSIPRIIRIDHPSKHLKVIPYDSSYGRKKEEGGESKRYAFQWNQAENVFVYKLLFREKGENQWNVLYTGPVTFFEFDPHKDPILLNAYKPGNVCEMCLTSVNEIGESANGEVLEFSFGCTKPFPISKIDFTFKLSAINLDEDFGNDEDEVIGHFTWISAEAMDAKKQLGGGAFAKFMVEICYNEAKGKEELFLMESNTNNGECAQPAWKVFENEKKYSDFCDKQKTTTTSKPRRTASSSVSETEENCNNVFYYRQTQKPGEYEMVASSTSANDVFIRGLSTDSSYCIRVYAVNTAEYVSEPWEIYFNTPPGRPSRPLLPSFKAPKFYSSTNTLRFVNQMLLPKKNASTVTACQVAFADARVEENNLVLQSRFREVSSAKISKTSNFVCTLDFELSKVNFGSVKAVKVRCVNNLGKSKWSKVGVLELPPFPPSSCREFRVSYNNQAELKFSWVDPEFKNGSEVTNCVLQYRVSSSPQSSASSEYRLLRDVPQVYNNKDASPSTWSVCVPETELASGKMYDFMIQAKNPIGLSPAVFLLGLVLKSKAPTALISFDDAISRVEAQSKTIKMIQLLQERYKDGGTPIFSYDVEWTFDLDGNAPPVGFDSKFLVNSTQFTSANHAVQGGNTDLVTIEVHLKTRDLHLIPDEKYWVRVRPVNLIGNGVWSRWIACQAVEAASARDSLNQGGGGSLDRIIPNCTKICSMKPSPKAGFVSLSCFIEVVEDGGFSQPSSDASHHAGALEEDAASCYHVHLEFALIGTKAVSSSATVKNPNIEFQKSKGKQCFQCVVEEDFIRSGERIRVQLIDFKQNKMGGLSSWHEYEKDLVAAVESKRMQKKIQEREKSESASQLRRSGARSSDGAHLLGAFRKALEFLYLEEVFTRFGVFFAFYVLLLPVLAENYISMDIVNARLFPMICSSLVLLFVQKKIAQHATIRKVDVENEFMSVWEECKGLVMVYAACFVVYRLLIIK